MNSPGFCSGSYAARRIADDRGEVGGANVKNEMDFQSKKRQFDREVMSFETYLEKGGYNNNSKRLTTMNNYQNNDPGVVRGVLAGSLVLILLGGLCVLGLWGCPKYKVYSARKEGEALLAHAQSSKEVAVAEAKAKMESAALLAEADTIRAHGIAASNQIIGKSLEGNPAYLQWLFIDQLKDTKDQIIYVPSGQMGMPIMEASRLINAKQ